MSESTVTISTKEYLELVEKANVTKLLIDTIREFDGIRVQMAELYQKVYDLEFKVESPSGR